MPPYAPDSDNDDTPEVVPLASSKKASRVQENAVHAAERALRAKRKRDNQEKDRALKMAKVERQQQRQEQENPDEEDGDISAAPASKHLPDHLFSAAAASLSAPSSASQSRSARPKDKKGKKARRGGPKDVLVGSRTIRVLSSAKASAAASRTIPPPRVDKFFESSLQFKKKDPVPGDKRLPSRKDWQRRSAHLGVMRSENGPARKFVRSGA